MLLVLSPAKSLNSDRELPSVIEPSIPRFHHRALDLIKQLRPLSVADVGHLMDISDALATLNVARYETFKADARTLSARPALLLFDGDVYDSFNADSLAFNQWHIANHTIRILSGLYGLLNPLDLIQAHRLEMGTPLRTPLGKHLYDYWGNHITEALNSDIQEGKHRLILNLASEEYFKAIKRPLLNVPVMDCSFLDEKKGHYKTVSFFAKKARGLMARFIVDNHITDSNDLKAFKSSGYQFNTERSTPTHYVFLRPEMT